MTMSHEQTHEEQHELQVKTALDLAFSHDVAQFEGKFNELEAIFNIKEDSDKFDYKSSGFEDGVDMFAYWMANRKNRRFNAIREAAKLVLLQSILHFRD